MPYQLQVAPAAIDDELTATEDELGAIDEELRGVDDGAAELGATLERTLLAVLLLVLLVVVPLKLVASLEVALMPLALLIRKLPQVLSDPAFQLLTISSGTQQLPLPDQLQPR